MGERGGPVIGVIGGSGGVGSSSFAAVLALVAGSSTLVDLDCSSGGIDVLFGIEREAGARWSGLQVAGGHLDPADLRAGLPVVAGCAVLAADTSAIVPAAVSQVVSAAAQHGAVVLDLPRAGGDLRVAACELCDLVVVLVRADVGGLVAAHAVADSVAEPAVGPVATGAVVRRGDVPADEAGRLVGLPLLGVLPATSARRLVLDPGRPPRAAARVAAGVLAGVRR